MCQLPPWILHHRVSQIANLIVEGFESSVTDGCSREPFEGYGSGGGTWSQSQEDWTRRQDVWILVCQFGMLWTPPRNNLAERDAIPLLIGGTRQANFHFGNSVRHHGDFTINANLTVMPEGE